MNARTRDRIALALSIALVALHLAVLCQRIDPRGLLSPEPWYQQNYGRFFYTTAAHARLLREEGTLWGVDPAFAAGHLLVPGVYQGLSGAILLAWALPFLPPAAVVKLLVFGILAAAPFTLWSATRALGLPRAAVPLSLALGGAEVYFSTTYALVASGYVTILSSNVVLLLALAGLFRINRDRARPAASALVMAAAGVVVYFLSPNMLLSAGALFLLFWWSARRELRSVRAVAWLLVGGALAALAVSPVLAYSGPFLRQLAIVRNAADRLGYPWGPLFVWRISVLHLIFPSTLLVLVGALVGARSLSPQDAPAARFLRPALWLTAATILGFAALRLFAADAIERYGGAWQAMYVVFTVPFRLLDSLLLVLIPAAAAGIVSAFRRAGSAGTLRGVRLTLARGLMVLLAVASAAACLAGGRHLRPFQIRPPEEFRRMVAWMNEETDPQGRILVEGLPLTDLQPWGFDPAQLLPELVAREFAGLPTNESFDLLLGPRFAHGRLGERALVSYPAEELAAVLREYNIAWVVAASPEATAALEAAIAQVLEPGPAFGPYRAFRAARAPGFFLKGTGRARAGLNRIELSDVEPEDGEVVLSYHWFPNWTAPPGVRIERAASAIDPLGFLRIANPPRALTLVHDSRGPFRLADERFFAWWRERLESPRGDAHGAASRGTGRWRAGRP